MLCIVNLKQSIGDHARTLPVPTQKKVCLNTSPRSQRACAHRGRSGSRCLDRPGSGRLAWILLPSPSFLLSIARTPRQCVPSSDMVNPSSGTTSACRKSLGKTCQLKVTMAVTHTSHHIPPAPFF